VVTAANLNTYVAPITITDSASQTWQTGASALISSPYYETAIFCVPNALSITSVSFNASDSAVSGQFFEISGASTLDTASAAGNESSSPTVTAGPAAYTDIAVGMLVSPTFGEPSTMFPGYSSGWSSPNTAYTWFLPVYFGSGNVLTPVAKGTNMTLSSGTYGSGPEYWGAVVGLFKFASSGFFAFF
jgi:hypothetical protein